VEEEVKSGITVAIPSIPIRKACLAQAYASAAMNTLLPDSYAIAIDNERKGAPDTRQRALDMVTTPLVAFLDDDDEFMEDHLEKLYDCMVQNNADYVYSWFVMRGGKDPFPRERLYEDFDPANPVETTITTLVKTELAKSVGFKAIPERLYNTGEDFNFTLGCIAAGAKIVHLKGERTWYYNVHGLNTSGKPENWAPKEEMPDAGE
jgi:glycosyltransferase involved in cell wall biosynthesis